MVSTIAMPTLARDIAHQVEDAGGVAHPFSGNGIVRNRGQRHKNEAESRALHGERQPEIRRSHAQTEVRNPVHRKGSGQKTRSEKLSRIDLPGEISDQWHEQE
jgi:hypothetical protein